MNNNLVYCLALFTIISCSKESEPVTEKGDPPTVAEGILVLNEGAFTGNNASLSYRDESGNTYQNAFESVNERVLGDVLQSYTRNGDNIHLVVNNSQKVETISAINLESLESFSGFSSPRYLLESEDGKSAMVSNINFDSTLNGMQEVDYQTGVVSEPLQILGWCEQMLRVKGLTYIANTGRNKLIIYDGANTNEISMSEQPIDIVEDAKGYVWVLCAGGFVPGGAALYKFDPKTTSIVARLEFNTALAYPSKLTLSSDGQRLLYIEGGNVYRMSINDTDLPLLPFIEDVQSPYGLGVDPVNGDIYVGDAKDYSSKGEVYIYSKEGILLESFESGYLPNGFIFL